MVVVAADDGMLLSKINQMRVRRLGGKGRGGRGEKDGMYWEKGQQCLWSENKRESKGEEEKTEVK